MAVGLANDTSTAGQTLTQVATVWGIGLSVPIANRSLATETSINLHAWRSTRSRATSAGNPGTRSGSSSGRVSRSGTSARTCKRFVRSARKANQPPKPYARPRVYPHTLARLTTPEPSTCWSYRGVGAVARKPRRRLIHTSSRVASACQGDPSCFDEYCLQHRSSLRSPLQRQHWPRRSGGAHRNERRAGSSGRRRQPGAPGRKVPPARPAAKVPPDPREPPECKVQPHPSRTRHIRPGGGLHPVERRDVEPIIEYARSTTTGELFRIRRFPTGGVARVSASVAREPSSSIPRAVTSSR